MVASEKNKLIINAILNDDNSKVLNELYQSSLPQIVRYVCQNNGDEDEAKDVFQDAVVSLFTTVKLGKYDLEKDVNGFLFFVSRNLWINRVKKRNKQTDLSNIQTIHADESPVAYYITNDKEVLIDKFMNLLGSKCKEILKYVIYDNLSMKEIAKLMNLGGETVAKSTHYRCKQKMMEIVSKDQILLKFLQNELRS